MDACSVFNECFVPRAITTYCVNQWRQCNPSHVSTPPNGRRGKKVQLGELMAVATMSEITMCRLSNKISTLLSFIFLFFSLPIFCPLSLTLAIVHAFSARSTYICLFFSLVFINFLCNSRHAYASFYYLNLKYARIEREYALPFFASWSY